MFSKNTKYQIYKIRSLGAELCHANGQKDGKIDRQTDRHNEANDRLSQFCEWA